MAFKEVLWNLKIPDHNPGDSLTNRIENDKENWHGVNGDFPGTKYYIPADAKLGGL